MIKKWNLCSFKSVYEDPAIPFAPLTLFAGVNSSGKSTIIQSILLATQSLQNSVRKRAVILNGHILKLGTFADIHANGSNSPEIVIGFQLNQLGRHNSGIKNIRSSSLQFYGYPEPDGVESISCSFSFSPDESRERREMVQLQPSLRSCTFSIEPKPDENATAYLVRVTTATESVADRCAELKLKDLRPEETDALQFDANIYPSEYNTPYEVFYSKGSIIGAITHHFLPRAFLARYDEVKETAKQVVAAFLNIRAVRPSSVLDEHIAASLPASFRSLIMEKVEEVASRILLGPFAPRIKQPLELLRQSFTLQAYQNFLRYLPPAERSTLTDAIGEQTSTLERIAKNGRSPVYKVRVQGFPSELDSALNYVTYFFQTQVKYLAPLRDEPKPVYPLSGATDPTDIGFRGEHTASVLELNKTLTINFIASANLEQGLAGECVDQATLGEAVLDWLQYMGVITNLETIDLGQLGHKLQVSTAGQDFFRDLTHVGVGVSQVLPIVVLCLLAEQGSTLIFEQPELHLHPRVQSRLADFFLAMTALGKQCIVETHSEHMINKLRLRVASSNRKDLKDDIAMYFVESSNGRSKYSSITMNEFGTISNWPNGFFDEAEELSANIMEAALDKRARLDSKQ